MKPQTRFTIPRIEDLTSNKLNSKLPSLSSCVSQLRRSAKGRGWYYRDATIAKTPLQFELLKICHLVPVHGPLYRYKPYETSQPEARVGGSTALYRYKPGGCTGTTINPVPCIPELWELGSVAGGRTVALRPGKGAAGRRGPGQVQAGGRRRPEVRRPRSIPPTGLGFMRSAAAGGGRRSSGRRRSVGGGRGEVVLPAIGGCDARRPRGLSLGPHRVWAAGDGRRYVGDAGKHAREVADSRGRRGGPPRGGCGTLL
uniref:Uncharacterized protein n=1 Tax=Ananas comosus var. bracteatus TaxID=296719 RepID=A0A6V7QIG7_ANACO|nr:unnamed protein product [Ananas comosus var. bracteatus]